jgi:hypothetical protein
MLSELISHSPDLRQLRDEGYDFEVRGDGFLVVRHVPYVNPQREVKYGLLVMPLTTAGDRTTTPGDHVVMFAGDVPCHSDGSPMTGIIAQASHERLAEGLEIDYRFSGKPSGGYADFYAKVTTYVNILMSQARVIDPLATAQTFPLIETVEGESVFKYIDTATAAAGIGVAAAKLASQRIAIVGLGGSGSYILDLVAKSAVKEIHLFDGDKFRTHNAFRSPGAAGIEQLRDEPLKVAYFAELYSRIRWGIIPHAYFIDGANVDHLVGFDFVFLALDNSNAKRPIVKRLEVLGIRFADVGMGVYDVDGSLAGVLRVTTSTPEKRDHVSIQHRIPLPQSDDGDDEYDRNIQIADLNALNATLAIIKWKKLSGFYLDFEHEHHTTYTIDGNALTNEDFA